MGYTHYYTQKREMTDTEWNDLWTKIQTIQRVVKENLEIDTIADRHLDNIFLNGIEGEDYETFCLSQLDVSWKFCKTEHRPYDFVVMCIMLKMEESGIFDISSDGNGADWQPAKDFIKKHNI